MSTIEQQRAKYALEQVELAIDNGVNQKEYKSYAASLPAMIHMNGLGQAAAFFYSRGKNDTHFQLYLLLLNWLTQEGQPYDHYKNTGENHKRDNYKALLTAITDSDMDTYRLAQVEAQALMSWVKKFAKAFMGDQ